MLTIQRIEQIHPSALKLLKVLGVLDGSFMNEEFVQCSGENILEYVDAKKTLYSYSMIKCQQRQRYISEVNESFVTMHSLYQLSIRHYLNQRNLEREIIHRCYQMMVRSSDNGDFSSYQDGMLWGHKLNYLWQQKNYKYFLIDTIDYNIEKVEKCLIVVGFSALREEMLKGM